MTLLNLLSLILSALALIGTGYTYFRHNRKLKQQKELLNHMGLDEAKAREANKKKARIRGIIVYHGKGSNDLIITNDGEAEAREIRILVLDNSNIGCLGMSDEYAVQQLSAGNNYKFHFVTVEGASESIHLRYVWKDAFSSENQYEEYLQRR